MWDFTHLFLASCAWHLRQQGDYFHRGNLCCQVLTEQRATGYLCCVFSCLVIHIFSFLPSLPFPPPFLLSLPLPSTRVSFNQSWPWKLDPLAIAFWMLGWQACATTPNFSIILNWDTIHITLFCHFKVTVSSMSASLWSHHCYLIPE